MEQLGNEAEQMAPAESGHNSKEQIAELVRSINTDLDDVNSRMAVLAEERKKIKGRIKAELGWKVADFNAMKRLADLEDDARTQMLDTIRVGFQALSIGMQGSFLDAIAPTEQPAPQRATRKPRAPKSKAAPDAAPTAAESARWSSKDAYVSGYNTGIMGLDAEPRPSEIKAQDHELLRAYDRGHEDGWAAAEKGETLDPENPPELPEDLQFDA